MAEQVNIQFNLDTSKSNKSVQQLQKEVRLLTKELMDTQTGTAEFKKLNDELVKTRVELKQAKKDFQGLELKLEIDTAESEGSIRSLQNSIKAMTLEIENVEVGSEEFQRLKTEIAKANIELKGAKEELRGLDFGAVIGEVGKLTGGITAGFTAIAAVVGSGNDEFEQFAQTVLTGMAVAQGFKGALEGVDAAQKLLNLTLEANPMYKFVAIAAGVITALTLIYKWTKDNEKAQKELNEQQEEYNQQLRDSQKELDNMALKTAEVNNNLEEQIRLFTEVAKAEYTTEISNIGKEFDLTATQISLASTEIENYTRNSIEMANQIAELNDLKLKGNNLTEEEKDRIEDLIKRIKDNENVIKGNIAAIKNKIELTNKDKEISLQTAELIGKANTKLTNKIIDDTKRRTEAAIKNNKDLLDAVRDGLTKLERLRLDYYNSFIDREKDLELFRTEMELQEILRTRGTVKMIADLRNKLTELRIEQIEREKKANADLAKEQQKDLIKEIKDDIDQLELKRSVTKDIVQLEKDISAERKRLKEEEIKLTQLNKQEVKLTADEIKAIKDKEIIDNLNYLRELENQQSINTKNIRRLRMEAYIEDSQFMLDFGFMESQKIIDDLGKRLVLEKDLTIEQRSSILIAITELEKQASEEMLAIEEDLLIKKNQLRQADIKEDIKSRLMAYETVFKELNVGYGAEEIENFGKFLDETIGTDELARDLVNIINEISDQIRFLSKQGEGLNEQDKIRLGILKDQKKELGDLLDYSLKYQEEETTHNKLNFELEKLRNDATKENIALQLQRLQLIDAQANALMAVSNYEIERWEGNLERENAARKKQINLQRTLELTSVQALYDQKLIGHNDYISAVENIEAVARKRRIKADMDAYAQVMEFAQQGFSTYMEITDNLNEARNSKQIELMENALEREVEALNTAREANLITEETYEAEKKRLEDRVNKEKKKIEYDQAVRDKKAAVVEATMAAAIATIKAYGNPAAMALAAASGVAQIAIIQSQPLPEMEKGGLLKGRRHAQGGIMVEAEDGEIILNRNVAKNPALLQIASMMNESTGGKRLTNTTFMNTTTNAINNDMNFKQMVMDIVDGVASIPVNNIAVDTDKTVRKVKNLESKAKL